MNTAVVAGATGAAAHRLVETLLARGFRVVALSRRPAPPGTPGLTGVPCDLLDCDACVRALAPFAEATHLFYSARAAFGEGGVEDVAQNVAMLANVLEATEAAAPGLRHVHLVEGQKWYDVRLAYARLPAREDDPRHMPPNFYYDQEDLLRERQAGRRWTWSASRPHMLYDFAPERARNVVSTIGAWAALCGEFGTQFDFPGTPECWEALMDFTEASQFARALTWMAESPTAANQAFNVADGCTFRWKELWPRLAAHFGLPCGTVRPQTLASVMQDKDDAWQRVVARHGLAPRPMSAVVSWPFADFLWSRNSHNVMRLTKLRLAGFHDTVDTEARIIEHLTAYRAARLLP